MNYIKALMIRFWKDTVRPLSVCVLVFCCTTYPAAFIGRWVEPLAERQDNYTSFLANYLNLAAFGIGAVLIVVVVIFLPIVAYVEGKKKIKEWLRVVALDAKRMSINDD